MYTVRGCLYLHTGMYVCVPHHTCTQLISLSFYFLFVVVFSVLVFVVSWSPFTGPRGKRTGLWRECVPPAVVVVVVVVAAAAQVQVVSATFPLFLLQARWMSRVPSEEHHCGLRSEPTARAVALCPGSGLAGPTQLGIFVGCRKTRMYVSGVETGCGMTAQTAQVHLNQYPLTSWLLTISARSFWVPDLVRGELISVRLVNQLLVPLLIRVALSIPRRSVGS